MTDPAQKPTHQASERDLETLEQQRPVPPQVSTFTLEVIEGPDKGKTFVIDPESAGPVLVGQSSACAICLTDRSVSRRHLSLDPFNAQLRLSDLESTNGTLVNDVVALGAWLRGGELVQVGSTVLRVHRGAAHTQPAINRTNYGRMLGSSQAMQRIYRACDGLLASTAPLTIEGEPGTGKELLAEVLHERGPRSRQPFIVVDGSGNAANVQRDLSDYNAGAFAAAAGGTLLIREVCDLTPGAQQQLVKWLASRKGTSGAAAAGHLDVRLVVTSARDIDREVQEGRFGADLAEHLGQTRIELPPVRRREGDITMLAKHFWQAFGGAPGGLSGEMLRRLEARSWPNNVRDLRLAVAHLISMNDDANVVDAGQTFEELIAADLPFPRARELVLERFERLYIERMLARHLGNVSRAAEASGIARRYFQIVKSRHKKESPPSSKA
ncbi:MAG: sigma 54-dependent Fis family transcriptional regulator [Polyangiaceae bacterium]|nr:sigma 54-dependent Fis family transcriptional regulator [Polyangiaceae bacterium]